MAISMQESRGLNPYSQCVGMRKWRCLRLSAWRILRALRRTAWSACSCCKLPWLSPMRNLCLCACVSMLEVSKTASPHPSQTSGGYNVEPAWKGQLTQQLCHHLNHLFRSWLPGDVESVLLGSLGHCCGSCLPRQTGTSAPPPAYAKMHHSLFLLPWTLEADSISTRRCINTVILQLR